MIRIRAHVDGFRRCGMAHPARWKEYPDGTFSEAQLEELKAEAELQVELAEGEPKAKGDEPLPKFEDITVDQIKERLDKLGVKYPDAKVKADFYGLLETASKKAKE